MWGRLFIKEGNPPPFARWAIGEWKLIGTDKAIFICDGRQAITDLLKFQLKRFKPKEITELLRKKQSIIRKLLA